MFPPLTRCKVLLRSITDKLLAHSIRMFVVVGVTSPFHQLQARNLVSPAQLIFEFGASGAGAISSIRHTGESSEGKIVEMKSPRL